MYKCDRGFYTAVPTAVKAKMILDVLAGHRLVFLCGVDVFSLRFCVCIAGIRTADLMDDTLAIGCLRKVRDSRIPNGLRQILGIIPTMLQKYATFNQISSAACSHKSKAIRFG
ncbi:MAG: hypothetical protein BWZ04_03085 [Firmicutes bacterium ADurb.BinA205]|nr:MAG: hypothetical protein BWZ04_03085 [Firmicutes bacterium ADurb.BinA205]